MIANVFWRSVNLTGNQTPPIRAPHANPFWRSVNLTGNQTFTLCVLKKMGFWRSVNLTGNQTGRQSMKRALAKSPSLTVREVENKWVKRAAGYRSNMDAVNGKDYRDAVLGMFGQELGDTVWKDMRHVLKVRSGQPYESMYVYDLTTGLKIGQVTDSTDELQVLMPGTLRESLRAASSAGHAVAVMHNHPGSSLPSAADISSIARSGAKFGVIACHDGSIVKFAPTDERYQSYNKKDLKAVDEAVKRIINSKRLRGAREAEYISTIEAEVGASIERFVFSK